MKQLLVRGLEDGLVKRLKARARAHGISAEEEHRRILRDALLGGGVRRATLMEHLLSGDPVAPGVELDVERSRDGGDRETGL
jgi:plasmid stability protein